MYAPAKGTIVVIDRATWTTSSLANGPKEGIHLVKIGYVIRTSLNETVLKELKGNGYELIHAKSWAVLHPWILSDHVLNQFEIPVARKYKTLCL